ncbi:MAG: LD-carboxypeptidase [Candidatus Dojkabacteria bacterium]|nr:LD-carboxypeptidase [Candidatus Dojkabacteria bacterium]
MTTSSPIDRLPEEKIEKAYSYLRSKGWGIKEAPICRESEGYLSLGNIKERIKGLHDFVVDKDVDVIMSFWGGTNTNQLLPYVDYDLIKKNPKIYVGYSDTSALLLAITKKTNLVTYHGPAAITYSKPDLMEYCYEYFDKAIKGGEWSIEEPQKYADDLYFLREKDADRRIFKKNQGLKIFRDGNCDGEVVASNLQTLLVLAGTEYLPSLKNKVLFVEEAEDEQTPMIHRFFTQLSLLQDFKDIKGLVVGKFMDYSKVSQDNLETIFKEISTRFRGPLIYNASFGHTDPIFTIPNGARVKIKLSSEVKIKFHYD